MVKIEKYTSSGYAKLAMEVVETGYSIENNDSPVEYNLWLERGSTWVYDLNNESWAEATINGQTVISKYVSFDLRNTNRVLLGSGTLTIPHNEDGSKTITFWARILNVADQGDINWFSGTFGLTNIPRASAISSVAATELGNPVTINIEKKVNEFRHQVWWQVNDSGWIDLGTGHDTSVQFTVPIDYATRITNSDTGLIEVCVRTFRGNDKIGNDVYKRGIPIKVPASIVPTLEDVMITERTAQLAEFIPVGNFVKDKSVMRVEAINTAGSHGSTIVSTELTVDNLVVRAATGDFPANKAGNLEVTAKVTDSRGRTATKSKTIKVWDYYAPKIIGFLANRTGNGTNKTIISTVVANVSPLVIDGINRNPYTLKIQYSAKKDNRWIDAVNLTNETTERINRQINCGAFYELSKAYNIRLVIQDRLSDLVDSVLLVRSSRVLWAWGDNRAAIGGFPELEGHFESFLPVAFHSSLNVEDGLMSRGKPIQEFALTSRDGKSLKYNGDLNNLKTAGSYHAFGVLHNPKGTNNYGYVNVITHSTDSNYCVQQYMPFNSTNLHTRILDNGKWTEWTNVWINATYLNGWTDYGNDYHPVQYKINNNDSIEFRGSCKGGDATPWKHIFKLPKIKIEKQMFMRSITENYKTCTLAVYDDGVGNGTIVVVRDVNSDWLCLDGITINN